MKCGHPGKLLVDVMSKSFRKRTRFAQKTAVDSTSAKTSTYDPDDNSQQGPENADARPRADSSSVAGCNDADLEPTTDELERKRKRA